MLSFKFKFVMFFSILYLLCFNLKLTALKLNNIDTKFNLLYFKLKKFKMGKKSDNLSGHMQMEMNQVIFF
jgi:hypothetical protein